MSTPSLPDETLPVIEVESVTKIYPARRGPGVLLGRGGMSEWLRRRAASRVAVLQDISLQVPPGESLGIIGRNGSGKSTLLKLMAGVSLPTSGRVQVRGRIASLLELGAGFHPMLTGRENIYLNAGLLGMRRVSVDVVLDQILAFSGIEKFIDQPVDTYSSGMYVRLGFAVAVHANPDVFLVDEVLAVGDEEFQRKCRRKIGELKEQRKTIVFVSHDLGTVHALCDQVVLLQQGRLLNRGSAQATIDFYLRQVGQESGVHLLRCGETEAIFSNGRVSLFHRQQELTGAHGLTLVLTSLGGAHLSTEADWELLESSDTRLLARGRLLRVPVAFLMELELDAAGLTARLSLEVEREAEIEHAAMLLQARQEYTRYYFGDREGVFPEISPEHVQPAILAPPAPGVRDVALLPDTDDRAPLCVRLERAHPYLSLMLQNSDYMTGARIICGDLHLPKPELPLRPGAFALATLRVGVDGTCASVDGQFARMRARRRLSSGKFTATLEPGCVVVESAAGPVTGDTHWHTEIKAGDLWLMSHAVHWGEAVREENSVRVSGYSVRMPGTQHWHLYCLPGGFGFEFVLELDRPFLLQEYNVSVALDPAYAWWKMDQESGSFPPIPAHSQEWVHLNENYPRGGPVEAGGDGLPTCRLKPETSGFRMSALNTTFAQQARVIQALCLPERANGIPLEAGWHTLFRGVLELE